MLGGITENGDRVTLSEMGGIRIGHK
jgi:hypothetical protein